MRGLTHNLHTIDDWRGMAMQVYFRLWMRRIWLSLLSGVAWAYGGRQFLATWCRHSSILRPACYPQHLQPWSGTLLCGIWTERCQGLSPSRSPILWPKRRTALTWLCSGQGCSSAFAAAVTWGLLQSNVQAKKSRKSWMPPQLKICQEWNRLIVRHQQTVPRPRALSRKVQSGREIVTLYWRAGGWILCTGRTDERHAIRAHAIYYGWGGYQPRRREEEVPDSSASVATRMPHASSST